MDRWRENVSQSWYSSWMRSTPLLRMCQKIGFAMAFVYKLTLFTKIKWWFNCISQPFNNLPLGSVFLFSFCSISFVLSVCNTLPIPQMQKHLNGKEWEINEREQKSAVTIVMHTKKRNKRNKCDGKTEHELLWQYAKFYAQSRKLLGSETHMHVSNTLSYINTQ